MLPEKYFLKLSLVMFLFPAILISGPAREPDGYYSGVRGLTGTSLKQKLNRIISEQVSLPYSGSSTDTWDVLKETEKDPEKKNHILLFYTGWSVAAAQEFNNGKGWNREHIWARSHGQFDTGAGVGTDLHNLRPSDISVNAARNNYDFDDGGTLYTDKDGPTLCRSDADSWEPPGYLKGDVARTLFYMAVRYEGRNGEPDLELVDAVNTFGMNKNGKGYFGKLSTLLRWHRSDPVDNYERRRNDIVYLYQKNRNPFIDHPEFVQLIWGEN